MVSLFKNTSCQKTYDVDKMNINFQNNGLIKIFGDLTLLNEMLLLLL